MANNITPKLKAYVQTDATGRVVSGTPVFRTSKPKIGNWREIPMYYRGTNPSSTTSTTTSGSGGGPTAYVARIATSGPSPQWKACNAPDTTIIVYTNVSTFPLPPYTPIYLDATLTTLAYPFGIVAMSVQGYVYELINGHTNAFGGTGTPCGSITTTSTTTQGLFTISAYYQGGSSTNQLCPPGSTGNGTIPLYSNTPTIQAGSMLYSSPGVPLTFGGFYYKQVGQDGVFYAPADNGVAVQYSC